ncbi:MAG: class I SAM-dependent methyltransferase [Rhodospirillaceae bacterium]|jgi:predicted methyltransferase|nr:class I SAM-dependent methyltransferase [Rhodospirillaceae bacterium]MBT5565502.1 class I SAM-dependent methyltransferase [Rhodospirillaceae bacterium]MBT6089832.1 class I SAM-dependent methyltransferase [Rhodospirillaceae bacterium]MBT7450799.1 class I SAM-dependent methyltransferase [Rhodospirillaceae bacterium]
MLGRLFSSTVIALSLAISLASPQVGAAGVTPGAEIKVPGFMTKALQADSRPDEDKDRDAGRRPDQVMAFFGLERGDTVAEFMASRGYYVGVLSEMVGPDGTVFGQNNSWLADRITEGTPLGPRIAASGLTNVEELTSELEDPQIPANTLDQAYMILFYHDTFWLEIDRASMNKAIYKTLKPGGIYGVIDHHAAPGMGITDVRGNHRIERHVVVDEVTAAGFELVGETDVLENLEDSLDVIVFQPDLRGDTHRFVLKFQKPMDG